MIIIIHFFPCFNLLNTNIESAGIKYIKYPENKQVLRGKGSIDSKTNFSSDEQIVLSFTVNKEELIDYITLYHLSNILGLVQIESEQIFYEFMKHYYDFLKEEALKSFYTATGDDTKYKSKKGDIETEVAAWIKKTNNTFLVLLKTMRITTLPGTTNAFKVEIVLVPYYNSLKFVIEVNDFWKSYNKKIKEKFGGKLKKLTDDLKTKLNDNNDFIFKFINKKTMELEQESNKLDIFKKEIKLEKKYIDGYEIILNNNIVSIPMQNAIPSLQHLGKGDCSLTVNMNFARNLGSIENEPMIITLNELKTFSKLIQKEYYFEQPENQHFLIEMLNLNSFSIQGLVNNDIESDEFQLSNISCVFTANSYNITELTSNVADYNLNKSKETIKIYLENAVKFFEKISKEDFTDNIKYFKIYSELDADGKEIIGLTISDLLYKNYLLSRNSDEIRNDSNLKKAITIKSAKDDKSLFIKGYLPLVRFLYAIKKASDLSCANLKEEFERRNKDLYNNILSYLIPQMITLTNDTDEVTCNKKIFEVVFTEYIFNFIEFLKKSINVKEDEIITTAYNFFTEIFFTYKEKEEHRGLIFNKAMALLELELSELVKDDKMFVYNKYKNILKTQIKTFKLKFEEVKEDKNIKKLIKLNKILLKMGMKYQSGLKEKDKKQIDYVIDFLSVFFGGWWLNSTSYFGICEKIISMTICNRFAIPAKVLFNEYNGLESSKNDRINNLKNDIEILKEIKNDIFFINIGKFDLLSNIKNLKDTFDQISEKINRIKNNKIQSLQTAKTDLDNLITDLDNIIIIISLDKITDKEKEIFKEPFLKVFKYFKDNLEKALKELEYNLNVNIDTINFELTKLENKEESNETKNKGINIYNNFKEFFNVETLQKLIKQQSVLMDFNKAEDYNYKLDENTYFWDNSEHPMDIFEELLQDNKHSAFFDKIKKVLDDNSNYIPKTENDTSDNTEKNEEKEEETEIEQPKEQETEEFLTEFMEKLSQFGYIYTDTEDYGKFIKEELGYLYSLKNLTEHVLANCKSLMPIYRLEIANTDVIYSSLYDVPYSTLEELGYSNKLIDVNITTNRITKIKTTILTLVDVEDLIKSPYVSVSNNVNEDYSTYKQENNVIKFKIAKKEFPLRKGNLIRLYIGNTSKEISNVFNGSVDKIEFNNGFIRVTANSFAKELYNGKVSVKTGSGGEGLLGTVLSLENIKDYVTNNDMVNTFTKGSNYTRYIETLIKKVSTFNTHCIPANIDVDVKDLYNSSQFIIALTALTYGDKIRYLDNNFFNLGNNKMLSNVLLTSQYEGNMFYTGDIGSTEGFYTTKEEYFSQSRIMENIYNVDVDAHHYGLGIKPSKAGQVLNSPTFKSVLDIVLFALTGPIGKAGGTTIGFLGKLLIKMPIFGKPIIYIARFFGLPGKTAKVFATLANRLTGKFFGASSFLGKAVIGGTKVIAKNSYTTIIDFLGRAVYEVIRYGAKFAFSNMAVNFTQIVFLKNFLSKIMSIFLLNPDGKFIVNTSSYIPRYYSFDTGGYGMTGTIDVFTNSKSSNEGSVSYTFREEDSFGNILNILQNRYSGVEWDVIESGGYATLFFGRYNYNVKIAPVNLKTDFYFKAETNKNLKCSFSQMLKSVDLGKDDEITILSKTDILNEEFNIDNVYTKQDINTTTTTNEYINKKVKFRNKIYAMSGYNLISSVITTNKSFFNAIETKFDASWLGALMSGDIIAKYVKNDKSDKGTADIEKAIVKSFEGLPDEFMNIKELTEKETGHSLNSLAQASELCRGFIEKEMKNYYDGRIVLHFDPTVKRGTEITLCDIANDIYGSVIAKEVIHSFDGVNGLITTVIPEMKTEIKHPFRDFLKGTPILNVFEAMLDNFENKQPQLSNYKVLLEALNTEYTKPYIYSPGVTNDDALNMPLLLFPLYARKKVLMPDELLYNSYHKGKTRVAYEISEFFYNLKDAYVIPTVDGLGIFVSNVADWVVDGLSYIKDFAVDSFKGRNLSLEEIKKDITKVERNLENDYVSVLTNNIFDEFATHTRDFSHELVAKKLAHREICV